MNPVVHASRTMGSSPEGGDDCDGDNPEDASCALPVKNTFIHFDGADRSRRALRRNSTDPSPPPEGVGACGNQVSRSCVQHVPVLEELGCLAPQFLGAAAAAKPCGQEDVVEQDTDLVQEAELDVVVTPDPSPRRYVPSVAIASATGGHSEVVAAAAGSDADTDVASSPPGPTGGAKTARTAIVLSDWLEMSSPSVTSWAPPAAGAPSHSWPTTPPPRLAKGAVEWTPPKSLPPAQVQSPYFSGAKASAPSRASSQVLLDGDGIFFTFTLRRADDVSLGMNVTPIADDRVLLVRSVTAGGAIESWNRQCMGSGGSAKKVLPGDTIVSVNGKADCAGMLEECKSKLLLKVMIVRGGLDREILLSSIGSCADAELPHAG